MALFPDLGSWLFRSVKRDSFTESPVLAIERLTTQPRPIGDSDKDTLVGAMLTLGSSLNQALNMVLEILPEDKSGERLGEILCPTLGQLLVSLQNTLSSFEPREEEEEEEEDGYNHRRHPPQVQRLHRLKHSRSESALRPTMMRQPSASRPLTPILIKKKSPPQTPRTGPARFSYSPAKYSSSESTLNTEQFPVFQSLPEEYTQPRRDSSVSTGTRGSVRELAVEIQSELRVQAAIQVAVESLEFAEGQLQMVKAINRLHGGNFEKLQRHFYAGYNNLLIKALQLEQREFSDDSESEQQPPPRALPAPQQLQQQQPQTRQQSSPLVGHKQQASIHVSFPTNMPTPSSSPRRDESRQVSNSMPDPQPLIRRNTTQGIKEEDAPRPAIKRRLSLAEELALAGDSDEDEYDDDDDYDESGDDEKHLSEPESAKSSGVSDFDPPGPPKFSTAARLLVDLMSEADSLGTQSESQEDDSEDGSEEDEFDEEDGGGNMSSSSSNGIVNGDNLKSMMMPRLQETLL
ncbi:hypothetical protein QBC43DRAFT_325152 [Cladorrhinum sp. PSN259]|nr:hypothetical protein QBC43DRAFT_325152 [Cladorrhinum sp. PSN259]